MAFYDSRVSKFFVDKYNLTPFTRDVAPKSNSPLRDVTVLGDTGRKWFRGTGEDVASWSGLFDDGASGSDVIMDGLRAATVSQVISIWSGDTVLGNQGYGSGDGWSVGPEITSRVGNMVEMSAEIQLGLMDRLKSLGPLVSKTATFNGTSIDDAASSSSGGKWIYHIVTFSATGGNARWQIVLQDSANNSTFATVASESVNITAVGAARRVFTGTLRRYVRVRVVLDATSGTLEFFAAYERD
jgi:hypothetical protein